MTDVKTPGNKTIAKKWHLSPKKVASLVKRGAKHEQEHDTDLSKASETARDHIGERPDYYKMLDKAEKMDKNKLDKLEEVSKTTLKSFLTKKKKRVKDYSTPEAFRNGVQSPILARNKIKGKNVKVPANEETQIDEISAELVGKVSNARWRQGKAPSKTLSRAINKKFIEGGKKKDDIPFEGSHKRSHEKSSTHVHRLAVNAMKHYTKEETTMDTKDIINEALDNILENNLVDMKENFLAALQEKAMERLEEKKKEIASEYFAQ